MHRFNFLLTLLISTASLMGMQNSTTAVKVRPDVLINQKIEAFEAVFSWKNYFLILGASAAAGGLLWSYAHAQQKINNHLLQKRLVAHQKEFQEKQQILETIVPVFIQMGKQKPIPTDKRQAIGQDVAKYIRTFFETKSEARTEKKRLHDLYRAEYTHTTKKLAVLKNIAIAIPSATMILLLRVRLVQETYSLLEFLFLIISTMH